MKINVIKAMAILPITCIMYKESGSRPIPISSLNICRFVKPVEESFNRFSYRGYGRREQVICGLVPLLSLLGGAIDGLDQSQKTVAFGLVLPFLSQVTDF